jgi:hypothetical protein
VTNSATDVERAFAFLELNGRPAKPRTHGVTEIRGPYYTPVGRSYLADVLETMGAYVDTLKYAGGSFALMPRQVVRAFNDLCHEHDVAVSTGGFLETVLGRRGDAVVRYLEECRRPHSPDRGRAQGRAKGKAGGRDPVRRRRRVQHRCARSGRDA